MNILFFIQVRLLLLNSDLWLNLDDHGALLTGNDE
jgi:hypothetical protein